MTEVESSGESVAPSEKPAGEIKAKPAVAKKPAPELKPLVDNGDGTATDPNTELIWKKADAWLDTHKFYTWQTHQDYVDKVNKEKFAGYDNWRIPSKAEALTLVDKTGTKQCEDKNGTMFPIDPIFDVGCVSNTWIVECSDDKIIRFDLKIGIGTAYPGKDVWGSIRLVSKPGEVSAEIGGQPDTTNKLAEEKEASAAQESTSAPTPKTTSKPAGSVPRPVSREVSEEQKVVLKARAKAFAEAKKKK